MLIIYQRIILFMSNLTALIASAELTEAKLNRFENILDTLLKDRSSSTRAIKINHQVETVDPTSISLTLTEISVGLLAWTSMCIGVASATKFEPLFTTLGTLACFVIYILIFLVSSRKNAEKNKTTAHVKQLPSTIIKGKDSKKITKTISDGLNTTLPSQIYSTTKNEKSSCSTTVPLPSALSSTSSSVLLAAPPFTPCASSTLVESSGEGNLIFSRFDSFITAFEFKNAADELENIQSQNASEITTTAEFLWRKSDVLQSKSSWMIPKSPEAIQGYQEALDYGELAVKADPTNAKACEVLASVLGICLEFTDDQKKKLDGTWRILELCEKATQLDSSLYLPSHIIGRIQFGVASLSWWVKNAASYLHARAPWQWKTEKLRK